MFTPVSLFADGVTDIPLIAANRYHIGTVHVNVQDGEAIVTYDLNSEKIAVKGEFLTFLSDLGSILTVLPEEIPGTGLPFGKGIDTADAIGESKEMLLFMRLVIDFDIYAPGIEVYHEGMFGQGT